MSVFEKDKFHIRVALLASFVFFLGFTVSGLVDEAVGKDEPALAEDNTPTGSGINPTVDPSDPSSIIYLDTAGKKAGVGDPDKPASETLKVAKGWHPQALTGTGLPRDKYGLVDWAQIIRDGLIKPRHSLNPEESEMPPLDMDVIIPAKSDYVDDVKYPHNMHTYWLKCAVCHPKIFVPAKGQNHMTMAEIANGKWCGRCHGKVAFPLTDCNRCHTVPKQAQAE